MNSFLWLVFFIIGVCDARQHRIPNYLVCMVFIFTSAELLIIQHSLSNFSSSILASVLVFVIALLCHLSGWMAPGDVKLLSAVGFCIGFNNLLESFFWIGISTVFIGVMYWMVNYLLVYRKILSLRLVIDFITALINFRYSTRNQSDLNLHQYELVMPFAPVVIIGLALSNYAN